MKHKIKLGDLVQDKLTGLQGIAVSLSDFLHGCRRINIQPQEHKDSKPAEWVSFDEPQLKLVKPEVAKRKSNHTGGPKVSALRERRS